MLTVEQANMQIVGQPKIDGMNLVIEVVSDDRETLTEMGRQFVVDWLNKSANYASWATAGVDKASGPICFDPKNPEMDPYEVAKTANAKEIKWKYRQLFRLTRMI